MYVWAIGVIRGHLLENLVIFHVIGTSLTLQNSVISYVAMLLFLKTFVPFLNSCDY